MNLVYKRMENLVYSIYRLLLILITSIITIKPLLDPDMFWHIKTGQWMWRNGIIVNKDVFSILGKENGLKWITHEWGFELLASKIYDLFNWTGLYVFVVVVFIVTTYLICEALRNYTGFDYISYLVGIFIMSMTYNWYTVRPQIITYLMVSYLIFKHSKLNYSWKDAIFTLFIITIMHMGTFIFILCLNGFIMVDVYLNKTNKNFTPKAIKEFIIDNKTDILLIVGPTLLLIALNPHKLDLIMYSIKMTNYKLYYSTIVEWFPTKITTHNLLEASFVVLFPVVYKKNRLNLLEGALVIGILLLGLSAYRHFIFIYLIVYPIMLRNFIPIVYNEISLKLNEQWRLILTKIFDLNFRKYMTIALVIPLFLSLYLKYNIPIIDFSSYPSGNLDYMKSHNITRFLNEYGHGGYLIFKGVTPWIDGRADLFTNLFNSDDYYAEYMEVMKLKKPLEPYLLKYNIKYLLLSKSSYTSTYIKLSDKFKVVSEDNATILVEYIK